MSAETVQANYQTLDEASGQFSTLQQNAEEVIRRVRSRMDPLLNGGWEGEGRDKFEEEMTQEVLPRFDRLVDALGEVAHIINAISNTMQEAEQQAKNLLNQD